MRAAKGIWLDETIAWNPTSETPLKLAFGSESIIPSRSGVSFRVSHHKEGKNDEVLRLNLDLLDEVRATTK